MKKIYLVLCLLAFIVSCSHAPKRPKKPEHKELFVTHILADGTKMFSYNMILERPQGSHKKGPRGGGPKGGGSGRKGNRGDRGKQGESKQNIKKQFYANLEKVLHNNDYCRDSYKELNSFIDREGAEMKGQCNEKANGNDRIKFKNQ